MTVQLGAHVGQQSFEMEQMRALWRWLDENGFDWISAWDHIYEAPPAMPNPGVEAHFEAVATLAAMAVETMNARLGCLVFYVGYRNPGLLAKAAITIDHLSGGRFELGLGGGWHQWEAEAYGYPFPGIGTRLDMLDEATQVIGPLVNAARFVDGELDEPDEGDDDGPWRTSFEGEHYRLSNASCLPPPRFGSMPLWIGGLGEKRTIPLVARYADGWNAAYVTPEEFADKSAVLDAACEREGRDPADVERSVNLMFAMGSDRARADAAAVGLAEQWGSLAERVAGGALTGTPDEVVEQVLAYAEAGADMVNIALRSPFEREALDAYSEVVMPQVRAQA